MDRLQAFEPNDLDADRRTRLSKSDARLSKSDEVSGVTQGGTRARLDACDERGAVQGFEKTHALFCNGAPQSGAPLQNEKVIDSQQGDPR